MHKTFLSNTSPSPWLGKIKVAGSRMKTGAATIADIKPYSYLQCFEGM